MQYQDKLELLEKSYVELELQMADPVLISDGEAYRKAAKRRSDLEDVVSKYREYRVASKNLEEARGMKDETDPELRVMAEEEISRMEPVLAKFEEELKVLLLPKDPKIGRAHV